MSLLSKWLYEIDWSAVATVALVFVTAYYAWSTRKILTESQRTREATWTLAKSSQESTQIMKQQIEQDRTIGRMIIVSVIKAAQTNIEEWETISIASYAVGGYIPENVNLVPLNAESAIQHARLLSSEGTVDLMSGLENLRRASWELNFVRQFIGTSNQTPVHKHSENIRKYIESASADLEAALKHFDQDVSSSSIIQGSKTKS